MQIRKAIIPAAGLGTRFLPATKALPKEMLPIIDKPTIQFIVEEAVRSGIEDIIIITNRNKRAIEDHFDRSIELEMELEKNNKIKMYNSVKKISSMANIYYIRQKEALGLGHAIGCAKSFIGNEPFAVMLGDDIVASEKPALLQLINVYYQTGHSILGVQPVDPNIAYKYGIVAPEGNFSNRVCRVAGLVEKPKPGTAPSNVAILGRYILTPEIFNALEETAPGHNGEIQLTDALQLLLNKEPIYACDFSGKRFDVGDKMSYLSASIEFALSRDDLSDELAFYLAKLSLDKNQPIHGAIAKILKSKQSKK